MQTITSVDYRFYRELGKQIRHIREERRLTLKDVSRMTGYSRPMIDRWELGLSKMKTSQLERLCDVLQVTNNLSVDVRLGFEYEGL